MNNAISRGYRPGEGKATKHFTPARCSALNTAEQKNTIIRAHGREAVSLAWKNLREVPNP